MNHSELRLLCNDLLLNGNSLTTRHDNEWRRMSRQLDNRLGRQSTDLSDEDMRLLRWGCLNSNRNQELRLLTEMILQN
jgi:hypothetical protein